MAVTMAPTVMQTASVNAASAAVQSLAGGAIAMAYVSTALNKMDNIFMLTMRDFMSHYIG